jgi:hypothetical protein
MSLCQKGEVVQGGPPTPGEGVDRKTHQTAEGHTQGGPVVHPKTQSSKVMRRETGPRTLCHTKEELRLGVDRWTTRHTPPSRNAIIPVHPSPRGGWTTVDRLGEVDI